ncbi:MULTISPECIES: hypothetical protein [Streptomyces]|uniref:Uncharacterized protein n=2 Tax=Streptomyces TaxID=1883 RepID=A0A0L8K8H4_STRVR|nr:MULTISPECIES: hypothetical protein [Streptomyces]KOG22211.1 hypothetical protein ADK34_21945 [Streptomyces viridochromogenes]
MLTLPPTGRHRPRPAVHPRPAPPAPAPRHRAPTRRSPYAREQATPLDGSRSPLARPYLAAEQRRRRRTLWLATVGLDVDQRDIHALRAAAGSAR